MLSVARVEHKFFIHAADVKRLTSCLDTIMMRDPHCVSRPSYKISSLYFDTEYDDDLAEKLDGVRYREKYRVRIYDDNVELGKFEVKRKIENTILKKSIVLNGNQIAETYKKNYKFLLENDQLAYVYGRMKYKNYAPRSIVSYDRTAFTLPYDNIRITLDMNMRSHGHVDALGLKIASSRAVRIVPKDYQILEVKYQNELPTFIGKILTEYQLSKTAISKYSASRLHSSRELNGDEPYFSF